MLAGGVPGATSGESMQQEKSTQRKAAAILMCFYAIRNRATLKQATPCRMEAMRP